MKKKNHSNDDRYEADPFDLGPDYQLGKILTRAEQKALGLPSPEEIAAAHRSTKITLALDSDVVAFFKEKGKALNMPYQVMIRHLLSDYIRQGK